MNRPCVLAVDDDPIALRLVEAALNNTFKVAAARDLASARAAIEASPDRFDCVLIDYQLPDGDGTELLRWLRERDLPLAAIVVTASEEHDLVRQTMVDGACNFLQKPISRDELLDAVATAASTTARRRALSEMRRQVRTAGKIQERLLYSALHSDAFVEYTFLPRHECGGDFLVHHRSPNGTEVFIVSDVAGHDIAATVQSSFFHGWVTAMLDQGIDVESALQRYNRRLLESRGEVESIAITALRIDSDGGCITGLTCGGAPPVRVNARGRAEFLGGRCSSPLGWFDGLKCTVARAGCNPSPVWMWTDGLDQLAGDLGVDPISVAFRLLASEQDDRPAWLDRAKDDVLVARIWPGSDADFVPPAYFHPLIVQECSRDAARNIDLLQANWKRSLAIALPALPDDTLHDVLLAAREALLNAVQHGCCGGECASFQVLYNRSERILRVCVDDPGAGYDFDWRRVALSEPAGRQTGLLMIHSISSRVSLERNGAELTMDYFLAPDLGIIRLQEPA